VQSVERGVRHSALHTFYAAPKGAGAGRLTSFSGPRSFTKAHPASSAGGTLGLSWPPALLAGWAKRTTTLGKHGQAYSTAAEHRSRIVSTGQRARSQILYRTLLSISCAPSAGAVHTMRRRKFQGFLRCRPASAAPADAGTDPCGCRPCNGASIRICPAGCDRRHR
jgi:hypothetical protein